MKNDVELEIKDNDFLRQFETRIDGQLVKLEYSLHPRKIFLTKFVMNENLKNCGYDQKFMERVFDKLSEQKIRVVPTCPEVKRFFKANKRKYKSLLPIGINF